MTDGSAARVLAGCGGAPATAHDLVMFDMDGVVKVGASPVPGAAEQIRRVRDAGTNVAFVTNNASRSAALVAAQLRSFGISAEDADVVTSAQAAAQLVREEHGAGAAVILLGGEGLSTAVAEAGLAVTEDPDTAVALMSGYGPDVLWRDVMRAAVLVREGLPYVASNTDATIPTRDGEAPGHGALVGLVSGFAGVTPRVAGKPSPPLLEATVARFHARRPLMVGDRLDTDILGARNVGADSLLVTTGVTTLATLVMAPAQMRPTYVANGLAALHAPHPAPVASEVGRATCGGWEAVVVDGLLEFSGGGDEDDWLRACARAAWSWTDAGRGPVSVSGTAVPGGFTTRLGG